MKFKLKPLEWKLQTHYMGTEEMFGSEYKQWFTDTPIGRFYIEKNYENDKIFTCWSHLGDIKSNKKSLGFHFEFVKNDIEKIIIDKIKRMIIMDDFT